MSTEVDSKQTQWQKLFGYVLGNQAAWIADIASCDASVGRAARGWCA